MHSLPISVPLFGPTGLWAHWIASIVANWYDFIVCKATVRDVDDADARADSASLALPNVFDDLLLTRSYLIGTFVAAHTKIHTSQVFS